MPHVSLKALRKEPTGYLGIELIPKCTWGINVRTKLSKEQWNIIRRDTYRKADYACEICGGIGDKWPVECHEKWEWDGKTLVQRLVGFVALCPSCHGVKHMGHSQWSLSKTALGKLYRHQRVVNKWRKKRQALYFMQIQSRQERKNTLAWTVDISYAKVLLRRLG